MSVEEIGAVEVEAEVEVEEKDGVFFADGLFSIGGGREWAVIGSGASPGRAMVALTDRFVEGFAEELEGGVEE